MKDMLEWMTLRGWVKQWLNYLKWYWSVAMSPEVTLRDFFDAPVVNPRWDHHQQMTSRESGSRSRT